MLNVEEFFSLWPVEHFEPETASFMHSCCSAGYNWYIISYTEYHAQFDSEGAHAKMTKAVMKGWFSLKWYSKMILCSISLLPERLCMLLF